MNFVRLLLSSLFDWMLYYHSKRFCLVVFCEVRAETKAVRFTSAVFTLCFLYEIGVGLEERTKIGACNTTKQK
jgi:hypothetical protein